MAVAVPIPKRLRRKRSGAGAAPLRGLIPLVLLLALWQVAGSADALSFPRPDTWLTAIERMNDEGVLLPALRQTLWTFLLSLIVATIVGALAGMAIGSSRRLDRAVSPLLDFFRTLPPPAIVPVAVLLLGATLTMSITVVVLAIVWPILLNTVNAMRGIPAVRLEMSRTLGLSRFERLRKIVLPSLAPGIMLGVQISVSISLVVTLLVDILGAGEGAGQLLVIRQQTFDAPAVWGLLLIIGAFGYLINAAVGLIQQRLFRNWPDGSRG